MRHPARSCARVAHSAKASTEPSLEVALERPAVGHLLPATDPWLPYPRQHEPFGRGVLGHTWEGMKRRGDEKKEGREERERRKQGWEKRRRGGKEEEG